jgi:hypothetical protein
VWRKMNSRSVDKVEEGFCLRAGVTSDTGFLFLPTFRRPSEKREAWGKRWLVGWLAGWLAGVVAVVAKPGVQ